MLENPLGSMIFTNLLSVGIMLFSLIVFKKFFPDKKISPLIIVLLFSIPPLLSILRPGTYESSDLSLHTTGSLAFYNALVDGDFIPRWAGESMNGYGTAHHQIMYFLPRLIPALIHFTGIPILTCVKIYLILTFVLSGIGMYLFAKKETHEKTASVVAAILYMYAPYHLIDLHFRVAVGELLAFTLLPFCFLASYLLLKQRNFINFIFLAASIFSLILSHIAIAVFTIPILFLYLLIKSRLKINKSLFYSFSSIILGIGLSSFYLLPLLLESKFMQFSKFEGITTLPLNELLYSPYRFGLLFQGPTGDLSFIIGYLQIMIIFVCSFYLFKNFRKSPSEIKFCLLIIFILILLILPISQAFWLSVPFLRGFESTYRLLLIISFFVSILASYLIKAVKNNKKYEKHLLGIKKSTLFIFFIIFFGVFQTSLNWGNRRNIPQISDDQYFQNIVSTYLMDNKGIDYATPIWVDVKKDYFRTTRRTNIEFSKGKGEIKETIRKNSHHQYLINAKVRSTIKENTFYFPGWTLYLNDKEKTILYKDKSYPGVIFFNLEPGLYKVDLVLKNSEVKTFSNFTSIFAFLCVVLISLSLYFAHPHKRK